MRRRRDGGVLATGAGSARPARAAGADPAEPAQLRQDFDEHNRCAAGAYELLAAEGDAATVSLFASGSEVGHRARRRKKLLAGTRIAARVVSVPCFELLRDAPGAGMRP